MKSSSIEEKIFDQIKQLGEGSCFTPSHFYNLASEQAIHTSLHRLVSKNLIQRLAYGIYGLQKKHPTLGTLPPNIEKVAHVIAKRDKIRICPSGAYAANLLGLSDQVPAKVVFLSDGTSKKISIGNQTIEFKKTAPKYMLFAETKLGIIIQAFKFLGKEHVNETIMAKLKKRLSSDDLSELKINLTEIPVWMAKVIRRYLLENTHG